MACGGHDVDLNRLINGRLREDDSGQCSEDAGVLGERQLGFTSTAPPQCGHVSGRLSITCPMRLTTSSSVSPARSVATDRGRPPPRLPGTPPEYRAPPWGWAIFGGLLSKLLNALLCALPASGSPSLLI